MVNWQNYRVTSNEVSHGSWLPNSTRWWLMVLGYHALSRLILWSCDYMQSPDKWKTLFVQFCKSYGHQTWQSSGLWHGTKTQKIKSLLVVGSIIVKKWDHYALCQIFFKLCIVEPISVNCQKTMRPKMDMFHGLIYRPDCDDVISPVRFGSILLKQL